ncbi:MAG: glycosyltransferase [bacterium]|nr:glycosyltransferase [bacterium]
MKILIINWRDITHSWAGGAERHLHELAKNWAKSGHQVTMLVGGYSGALKNETIDSVEVVRVGNTYSIFFLAPLYYLFYLRNRKFNYIVDTSHGIPFFANIFSRLPVVLIIHHNHEKLWKTEFSQYISNLGIFIENKCLTRLYRHNLIATLSETTKSELLSLGFKNVQAIPPGIEHDCFKPSSTQKSLQPTILYLGRLRKYKRVDILINNFHKIKQKVPNLTLIIAGTGQDKDRLENLVRTLNLDSDIKFKGYISEEEKVKLLQESWVLAFPSLIEGWGLVALEAAACGTPTVGFNVPGVIDAVSHNHSGILVEDQDQYCDQLINILNDFDLRQRLSQGAIDWAQHFKWDLSSNQFLKHMEENIHAQPHPEQIITLPSNKKCYILAVHLSHNSTASLLIDGKIVGCVSEERFNRQKNFTGFPTQSIEYLLKSQHITIDDIDYIINAGNSLTLGWVPTSDKKHAYKKYLFLIYYLMSLSPFIDMVIRQLHYVLTKESSKEEIISQIKSNLEISDDQILFSPHHHCHAYSAFYGTVPLSQQKKPHLVLTHDGEGDMLCGLIMKSTSEGKLKVVKEISAGNSIAAVYGNVTDLMGMKINEHEYKIMGLSPYTSEFETKKVYPLFDKLIQIKGVDIKSLFGQRAGYMYLQRHLINRRFDGIAGAAQKFVEEKIIQWIKNAISEYQINDIVLGGGLFMNVKANKLIGELTEVNSLSICPSAADESTPIGAVYWGYEYYCTKNNLDFAPSPLENLYLGPEYSDQEIQEIINSQNLENIYKINKHHEINSHIGLLLSQGKIVARFSGRSEWGARALGNRSIMADPRDLEIIRVINEQIKSRDFWMPFASSILSERANDYLINPKQIEAPHMILAFDTTDLGKKELKAAIHPYDFTSRPQIVSQSSSPQYYEIIKSFETLTGVGGILNTSFNIHGEPIVGSPQDALNTFKNSGLRHLALGNYLLEKR